MWDLQLLCNSKVCAFCANRAALTGLCS